MINKKNIKLNNKDEVFSPESKVRRTSLDQINVLFNDVYENGKPFLGLEPYHHSQQCLLAAPVL